jgi:hypothetical protein
LIRKIRVNPRPRLIRKNPRQSASPFGPQNPRQSAPRLIRKIRVNPRLIDVNYFCRLANLIVVDHAPRLIRKIRVNPRPV